MLATLLLKFLTKPHSHKALQLLQQFRQLWQLQLTQILSLNSCRRQLRLQLLLDLLEYCVVILLRLLLIQIENQQLQLILQLSPLENCAKSGLRQPIWLIFLTYYLPCLIYLIKISELKQPIHQSLAIKLSSHWIIRLYLQLELVQRR